MRTSRAPRAILAAFCAAALAVSCAACGSSSAPLSSIEPVAQAADATAHSGGSELAMSMTVNASGLSSPVTITGSGSFNMAHREGQLDFQLGGLPAGAQQQLGGTPTFDELFKGNVLYMSSPLLAGRLPDGARWMKIDLGRIESSLGLNVSSLASGQTDPSSFLQYLRSAGSIHVVGHEVVRGTRTTRYEGALDLQKVAGEVPPSERAKLQAVLSKLAEATGLHSIPFSAWVDSRHLLRRIEMTVDVNAAGQSGRAEIELEMFDFGPTSAVTPPAASETFDATSAGLSGLASLG